VNLELSVNPDGTVHKVTIAKTSGKTEFDVAAVDTVLTAGPYEPTPSIRSVDGGSTCAGASIATGASAARSTSSVHPHRGARRRGVGVLDDGAMVKNTAKPAGQPANKDKPPLGAKPVTPTDGRGNQKVSPESSVTDKQRCLRNRGLGVRDRPGRQAGRVHRLCVPMRAQGRRHRTPQKLKDMYSDSWSVRPHEGLEASHAKEYTNAVGVARGQSCCRCERAKEAIRRLVAHSHQVGDYRATQLSA